MTSAGRPSLYRPEYDEQARDHCLLGVTNADLAELFGVAPRTIDNWIATLPDFARAVHEGRAAADAKVARSLYTRAVGFQQTVERTVLHRGEEHRLTNKVNYPPDTQACIFWLRNRRRQSWGDVRQDHGGAHNAEALALLDAAGERAAAEHGR